MELKKVSILNISLGSGGAEKVISLLLQKLVADYEVHLVLFYKELHFPVPEGVQITFFSSRPPQQIPVYRKLADAILFLPKYLRFIRRQKIQYAVSFLAFPNLLNGVLPLFNRQVRTIISERGYPSDNTSSKISYYISKWSYPLLYNRCDRLFSNSRFINADLKENFGVRIPMAVIYNPIEAPKYQRDPEESATVSDPVKVISVGSLNTRKNHAMILRAIGQSDKNLHLTLLGQGHLYEPLKQQAAALDIEDSVSFGGNVTNVPDYLAENDIFVLSSFTEGFPNALLEAMNIGLPCISTNCLSGPLELLNDGDEIVIPEGGFHTAEYGILINNDDERGLLRALEYLIANPEKRIHYAKKSLQRSKDFALDKIYGEFKDFIEL